MVLVSKAVAAWKTLVRRTKRRTHSRQLTLFSSGTGGYLGSNTKNWIDTHLQIVIPVAIVVGLLVLFCISRCIFSGTRGYRDINHGGTYVMTTIPGQAPPGAVYGNPYPAYPPPDGQYYAPPPTHPGNGWVDPSTYNGPSPAAPPPSYTPNSGYRDTYEMNPTHQWGQQPGANGGNRRFNEGTV